MPDIVHELVAQILSIADGAERRAFLVEHRDRLILDVVEQLKARADEQLLRDPSESLRIAEIAEEAAAFIADDLARAVALWAKGNALLYPGEYRACLNCYRQARAVYARHGKALEVARLQVNEIGALLSLAEYAEALRVADDARAALEPMGPTRYLATLEMNVGVLYRQTNDYEQALAAYARGREIFAALGDIVQAVRMDVNRAKVLENLDRFDEAERLLESARAMLAAEEMPQEVARVDLNLGTLVFRQGRYQTALQWLERARDGFAALKNTMEVAAVDLYRSSIYLALNLLPESLDLAIRSERVFTRQGMKRQAALAAINEGAAHRQLGEELAAMRCLARARRIFRKRGASVEMALLDMERAALLRTAGSVSSARRIAQRAATVFKSRGLIVRSAQADLLAAECALDLGCLAEAESLANAAAQVADPLKLEALTFRARYILGQATEQRGKIEEAYTAYRAAVEAVETLRASLRVDEFRAGFLADKLAMYEDTVRVALELGRLEDAFDLIERASTATLVGLAPGEPPLEAVDEADRRMLEELQALRRAWHWTHDKVEGSSDMSSETDRDRSADEDQAWHDRLITLEGQMAELARRWQVRQDRPQGRKPIDLLAMDPLRLGPSLGEIQQRLGADDALAQYFVVRGKIMALVVRADSTSCVKELASLPALDRLLDSWRFTLESLKLYPLEAIRANLDNLCADAQAHLARLYKALVEPLESRLEGCRRLFVIPCLTLPDVPLAALYDGKGYLAERCEIVHLPMANLLPDRSHPEATLAQPPQVNVNRPLVMGYSDGGRLRFAVTEAERVAAVLAQKQSPILRVEQEATETEFRAHTRRCNVLHLATHAAFRPDNPFFSWVRLADARITVADLYGMALPGHPLVTLSACETALGGQRGGGLIGLGRSFIAAGASALVVSLWKVDDASTAQFMEEFYRELLTGQPVGAALRAAQLEALRRYRHPLYWAPFILVQGHCARVACYTARQSNECIGVEASAGFCG